MDGECLCVVSVSVGGAVGEVFVLFQDCYSRGFRM